jgi:hypothetical protein
MTPRTPRTGHILAGAAGLALVAGLGTLTACTNDSTFGGTGGPVPAYRLVAFDSCADALSQIRAAAHQAVGPYGLNLAYGGRESGVMAPGVAVPQPATNDLSGTSGGKAALPDAPPGYSGTNTQELGVDEPDLVKTDGRRIVIVRSGVLRVIDAATHEITGSVDLADPSSPNDGSQYAGADLLLSGDHALVLLNGGYGYTSGVVVGPPVLMPAVPGDRAVGTGSGGASAVPGGSAPGAVPIPAPTGINGPRLILVDLAGQPRVLSRMAVDGGLLDARQTGSIARVVVSSAPRIVFPDVPNGSTAQRLKVNQSIIDQATLDRWLPRIDVTTGSSTTHVGVDCDAIIRPTVYSGSNLLTVLSLDLAGATLADPKPVTVLGDGQTVYSNGEDLYIATDMRWRQAVASGTRIKVDSGTTVYQFDTSKPGRPSFVAGGGVPGYLINQYAMSARDGYLRVATTSGNANWEGDSAVNSQSGVYVLHPDGANLVQVGKVEGLGKGEKIYAVRFLDTTAYVVTFKQTDPLFTVDLSDPTRPRVRGELKINGYSSYLHPIGDGRLIGIGQDVDSYLRTAGTQISLFDVSNLDRPSRLAVLGLPGSNSEAEFDPHAFLYWPANGLLVVPLNSRMVAYPGDAVGTPYAPTVGVLVLRVSGDHLSQLGFLTQPYSSTVGYAYPIRRSLVIGDTLWTVSEDGLMASDISTLQRTAWIPVPTR